MKIPTLLLALVACSPPLAAQRTVVLPRNYSQVSGWPLFEWACKGPGRVQNIFYVDPAASGTVLGIALRRRFDPIVNNDSPAMTVDLELGMGHSVRQAANSSYYYAENHDIDFRTVVRRQVFNFPSVRGQPQAPYPFSYRLPFDVPFTLQANRWALWDMKMQSVSPTCLWRYSPEAAGFPFQPNPVILMGAKCPALPGDNELHVGPPFVGARTPAQFVGEWSMLNDHIPVMFIGTRTDHWLGLPLPLDLTPFGAPGCFVHISLDYALPQPLTLRGFYTHFQIEIPNDTRFLGGILYFQAARFRSVTNQLGLVTSEAWQTQIGPRPLSEGAILFGPWEWGGNGGYSQRMHELSYVVELTLQ